MTTTSEILHGCCLQHIRSFANESVDLTVTSPPYFQQKDYGHEKQIGWEPTLGEYLAKLRTLLGQLYRVTAAHGSAFVVVGDTYEGGTMQLVPQRIACIAHDCGWLIRNDLIWAKSDAAPGRAPRRWRFTHEHIFFMVKSLGEYVFHEHAIRQPYSAATLKRWANGQRYGGPKALPSANTSDKKAKSKGNRFAKGKSFQLNPNGTLPADVITKAAGRTALRHYATFPSGLIETFVLAASNPEALVFDPFAGSGTTGEVALRAGRRFVGIELSEQYVAIARERLSAIQADLRR